MAGASGRSGWGCSKKKAVRSPVTASGLGAPTPRPAHSMWGGHILCWLLHQLRAPAGGGGGRGDMSPSLPKSPVPCWDSKGKTEREERLGTQQAGQVSRLDSEVGGAPQGLSPASAAGCGRDPAALAAFPDRAMQVFMALMKRCRRTGIGQTPKRPGHMPVLFARPRPRRGGAAWQRVCPWACWGRTGPTAAWSKC